MKQSIIFFCVMAVLAISCGVEPVQQFNTHNSKSVYTIDYLPDKKLLASGGGDETIMLRNLETGEVMQTLTMHKGNVWKLAFAPNGKSLFSAGNDSRMYKWELEAEEFSFRDKYNSRVGHIMDLAIASGNNFVAGVENNVKNNKNSIVICLAKTMDIKDQIGNTDGRCCSGATNSKLYYSKDGKIMIYFPGLGKSELFMEQANTAPQAVSPDESYLALIRQEDPKVFLDVVKMADKKVIQSFDLSENDYYNFEGIRFSPDSKYITFPINHNVFIHEVSSGESVFKAGNSDFEGRNAMDAVFLETANRIAVAYESMGSMAAELPNIAIWEF